MHRNPYLSHLSHDLPAGIVVFLVALPLCLGIALASGAPLLAGLVSGIVGGIVVSWASGSQLSVSGPAAGLTVIVLNAIQSLGSFESFLCAVILAGVLQLLLGYFKAGGFAAYFPSSVIKGMLAAIGIILIMKQIQHAVGYDADYEGDTTFLQADKNTTFSAIFVAMKTISFNALIVSSVAMAIMILWEQPFIKRRPRLSLIPGALIAVLWGVGFELFIEWLFPSAALNKEHFVSLPIFSGMGEIPNQMIFPNWSKFFSPAIYSVAFTIAAVASLETLMSLEAVDKLDPMKRTAPPNREILAQGIGNVLCGLLGGLPITAVIVRSSANILAGAKTKVSCFFHGLLLLFSVLFFAEYLNRIPLAALAAVLILVGYKLTKPALIREVIQKGHDQYIPFFGTIIAILLTDLLIGICIGLVIGLGYVIKTNFHSAITFLHDEKRNHSLLRFHKDVSFLNKPLLRSYLGKVQEGSYLIIDGSKTRFIDDDIIETIEDFLKAAKEGGITVELVRINGKSGVHHPDLEDAEKKGIPGKGGGPATNALDSPASPSAKQDPTDDPSREPDSQTPVHAG